MFWKSAIPPASVLRRAIFSEGDSIRTSASKMAACWESFTKTRSSPGRQGWESS
jgi:hypothetical protein